MDRYKRMLGGLFEAACGDAPGGMQEYLKV